VDNELVEENVSPVVICCMNTKFGGAGTIINPFGISNDGYLDLIVGHIPAGIRGLLIFDE
jgi:hypothetical protein